MSDAASNPMSCGCELCKAWRRERGLERVDVRNPPDQRELPVGVVPRVRDERLGWVEGCEDWPA